MKSYLPPDKNGMIYVSKTFAQIPFSNFITKKKKKRAIKFEKVKIIAGIKKKIIYIYFLKIFDRLFKYKKS